MRVEQIMTKQVQSCGPGDSLERAAQLMWDYDCGCIPVCTGNGARRTVGMITDRDICMNALFQGKPLRDLHVSEAMANEVRVWHPEDLLDRAEKILRDARIRRPFADPRGIRSPPEAAMQDAPASDPELAQLLPDSRVAPHATAI